MSFDPSLDESIIIPSTGICVECGTFILYNAGEKCVGRSLRKRDSKNVVARRCPCFQKSGVQQRHDKISHPWLRYTQEVVQSSTTDIISLSCVLNVAFVFKHERALAEAMTFQGCANFFILRHNTDDNPPNGFFPSFASEYELCKRVSCISSKIWKDLIVALLH